MVDHNGTDEKGAEKNGIDDNVPVTHGAETRKTRDASGETNGPKTLRRDQKGRWFKILVMILVLVGLVIWIGNWIYHQHTHVSSQDARIMTNQVTVSSRLPGRVTGFSLIEGDQLEANARVAQLYNRPDQLLLEKLQARVKHEQAQLALEQNQIALAKTQLSGGIQETQDQLQTDLSAVNAAKAAMNKAQHTYERSQRLFKSGTVSEQKKDEDYYTYQSAKAEHQQTQRQVSADRSALKNARNGMMSKAKMTLQNPALLKAKLAVTRESLAEAKADLRHQQLQLSDRTITSPVNGVVDKTFVEQGEYVSAGQPLIMMHVPDNVWVEANVKETKIHELEPGQSVAISVDAFPDVHFEGHVKVIGRAATSQFALLPNPNPSGNFTKITQRIPVRIAIDEGPKTQLSPGMMVEVDVAITGNAGNGASKNR